MRRRCDSVCRVAVCGRERWYRRGRRLHRWRHRARTILGRDIPLQRWVLCEERQECPKFSWRRLTARRAWEALQVWRPSRKDCAGGAYGLNVGILAIEIGDIL